MQDNLPIITLEDVRVHYASEDGQVRKALDGVSFTLHQGEWISIVGANGSGKSTLAGLLIGFIPLSGGVRNISDELTVRGVLQQPDAQVLGDTIEEEFHYALSPFMNTVEEQLEQRKDALHTVGLHYPPDMAISQLSGGQKQLLNIAVALAAKPDVLILDEPTAMLDPGARDRIEATVQKITQRGTTVIWITHHLEEATLCDRIIAIDRGRCVYDGKSESFFYETEKNEKTILKKEQLSPCERLGLDPPFTVKTALLLKYKKGMSPEAMPLRPEQLAKEVASWRSN